MDELELNLDTVSDADANLEVEGAEAQIEDIQNRYPDEDYRTPEQQALDAEQAEGTAEAVEPIEIAMTSVATLFSFNLRASSTAISSKGFMDIFTFSSSTPV